MKKFKISDIALLSIFLGLGIFTPPLVFASNEGAAIIPLIVGLFAIIFAIIFSIILIAFTLTILGLFYSKSINSPLWIVFTVVVWVFIGFLCFENRGEVFVEVLFYIFSALGRMIYYAALLFISMAIPALLFFKKLNSKVWIFASVVSWILISVEIFTWYAEPRVKLSAVPVAGAEPFADNTGLNFYVYEVQQDIDGKGKIVKSFYGSNPLLFKLEAGNYVVAAEWGHARIEAPLEAKAGETVEHTFVLNPGNMKLNASLAEGAEPLDYGVQFSVYEVTQDMDGKRKEVTRSYNSNYPFKLSAGNYVVAAEWSNARIEAPLEVKAGETVEHTFVLNAGSIKLKALPAEGAEPLDYGVWFRVYEAQQDVDGKRKAVKYSGNNPYNLAAGNYVVVAEREGVRVEAPVEVKAGESIEHTLILSAANPTETIQAATADKCSQASSCEDCSAVPGCGFCKATNACLNYQQAAQCTGDFQSTIASCHDCSPHQDEPSCSRDAYCGWNNQTQRCFNSDNLD